MKKNFTLVGNLSVLILMLLFSFSDLNAQFDCPGDITVEATAAGGVCTASVSFIAVNNGECPTSNPTNDSPYAADNASLDASGDYPVGETVVTFTDCDGAVECTATVTVTKPAPEVITQDITVYVDEFGFVSIVDGDVDGGSNDPCGDPVTTAVSPSSFNCSNLGDNTVMFSVSNDEGLTAMADATVTVLDTTPPVVNTSSSLIYLDNNGSSFISLADVLTSATDNCTEIPTLTYSPSNVSCADLGTVTVTVEAEDEQGNVTMVDETVVVLDTLAPELVNVNNDITIQLPESTCDTAYVFDYPATMDNCDMAPVSSPVAGSPISGDVFEIGVTEVAFESTDAEGNVAEFTFNITVLEYQATSLSCLTEINLSIDALTCESELTPEMLLTTELIGCPDDCTIRIMDEDGNEYPNYFDKNDIGKSYMYEVCCGGNCCMGTVNIEDKTPPQIECTSDTISCGEFLTYPFPTLTENCSDLNDVEFVLLNETFYEVDCSDPELQQIVVREYKAIDAAGNESNVCSQELSIAKFDINTIDPPFVGTYFLECGVDYPLDDQGRPDVEFFGGPRLNGVDIAIDQALECNLLVTFQDQTFQTGLNTYSIVRTFEATVWYCGQDQDRQFVQVFEIGDYEGPEITCSPDLTFSADVYDCGSSIVLPELDVYDVCGDVKAVTVNYEGGFINGNGGVADLPLGTSVVTYVATDYENNSNSCSFEVTIEDNDAPIAVCDQYTVVSLTNEGKAIVDAVEFDDGSFDACGPVTFSIRRMNPTCDYNDNFFSESVTFCCEDLGVEEMVVLRVTDEQGNFNECMVTAFTQDKTPPTLVQGLPDITVACDFPFNTTDTEQFGTIQTNIDDVEEIILTSDIVNFSGPAYDGLVLGGCLELESDEFSFENVNSCGIGTATRIITFSNNQGATVTDVQYITFENPSPFDEFDISYPADITLYNVCDLNEIPVSMPTFTEDACDQVGIDIEDKVIDNSDGAGACLKIIRTFSLVDWCQNDGGIFEIFEGTQLIYVFNTVAPEIKSTCEDVSICSYDNDCGDAFIELNLTATDDCTADEFLKYNYSIDAFSNGSIDIVGNTNDASGLYPVGIHTIYWTVSDGCGNEDVCSYTFEIQNCKTPTPYCLDNLTAGLTPMDLDGDGDVDTEMVELTPDFFDAGSFHVCGTDVQLSFSENVNDVLRVFDCEDLGEQPIEIWVTDVNGNQDYCSTSVIIQDNNEVDFCTQQLVFNITGTVKSTNNDNLANVEVSLDAPDMMEMTDDAGLYSFNEMPLGSEYTISPEYDKDPVNGISVADIILIQKHILGLKPLDSPYKMLAADVDNSTKVNGQDIIQIRKLLLGHYENFPANDSWKFIDAKQEFIDAANPWFDEINETVHVANLEYNIVADFVGIKIGDVNQSATMGLMSNLDTRTDDEVILDMTSVDLKKSEVTTVTISPTTEIAVEGMQLGFAYNGQAIEIMEVKINGVAATKSQVNVTDDKVKMVLSQDECNGKIEFVLRAKQDVSSSTFRLDDAVMMNMAYAQSVGEMNVQLREEKDLAEPVSAVFALDQNEPNPWMNSTTINFTSAKSCDGMLRIMNTNGKLILDRSIACAKGENSLTITSDELPQSGIYYYEITMDNMKLMKKMILIK